METPGLTVLRNAELYAPEPLGRRDLAVCAGRIVAVAPRLDPLPASWPAAEEDLEGRRLVPGFVDAHVHVTGGGGEAGPASRIDPVPPEAIAAGGTTSVVGLLGADDETRSPADLLARTRALAAWGLGAWCLTGGYRVPPVTLTGSVRGDLVHVAEILGVGEIAISDRRSSQPTPDEFLRVASDAYMGGLLSGKAGIVHLHVGDGERGLSLVRHALDRSEIPARVFHPTHVNRRKPLFEEALELARQGCPIDVSAYPLGPDDAKALSAPDAVRAFLEAGLPPERLTVTSDAGGSLPEFDAAGRVVRAGVGDPACLGRAVSELVRGGLPLECALPPFTSNPAGVLGLQAAGRIAPGVRADLVLLDDDHGVADVMVAGRWRVRGGRAEPDSSERPVREAGRA